MKTRPITPTLETLTHHRWAIPILALLHSEHGAKFVLIANRLQLSRDALSRSLTALSELGWVRRNPGYGHPLRPEYLLTSATLGPPCQALVDWLEGHELAEALLKKWSLPVLLATRNESRFTGLQRALDGITPRALTLTFEELLQHDLIRREGRDYSLTRLGLEGASLASGLQSALESAEGD